MRLPVGYLVGILNGAIVGSMLTLLLLKDRVDVSLQSDFDRWSSLLLFSLIALLAIEWAAKRMRKQS